MKKNSVLTKILICILCSMGIVVADLFLFQIVVDHSLNLVTTYIASKDILPRTKITEEDLLEVNVSSAYLLDNVYLTKEEIIGKYTDIQGKIPAGSAFYRNMLCSEDEMPDHPASLLREGQASYALQTDVIQLGSIIAGERIDIHVTIDKRDGSSPITGCLYQNVRVLSVKDHQGLKTDDPESSGIPYLIELAVNKTDVDLLTLAESIGSIRLFATDTAYDIDKEAIRNEEDSVTQYLQSLKETQ